MALVIYSVIPYMVWLVIDVFRYNKNLKKGKDIFQKNQLGNVMWSSANVAGFSGMVEFSKDMISTMIGLYAVLYIVYWVACDSIRRKHDRSFISK